MPLSPNQVYLVVSSIVDKFHTARTQLAVLKQFRRRRARKSSNPTIAARDRTTLRKEPIKRSDEPVYSPPHTVWEARGRPSTCQRPCKRIELIRSDKATTSASLGHSWSMTPFQGFGTDCPKISVSLKCSSSVDLPSVFCCADIVQPYSLPVLKEGDLDPGSASPEFFPLQREVQDADTESYSGSDSCRRLVITADLKDAYFHIQVVQQHRRLIGFAFGGKAYQYRVLPFGLALAQRTFTKCIVYLAPLRLQGVHVLNNLDDWLILTQSRELVCCHRDVLFTTFGLLASGWTPRKVLHSFSEDRFQKSSLLVVGPPPIDNIRRCLISDCFYGLLYISRPPYCSGVDLTSFTIVITEYSKDATIMHRTAQRLCANLQYGEWCQKYHSKMAAASTCLERSNRASIYVYASTYWECRAVAFVPSRYGRILASCCRGSGWALFSITKW